MTTNSIFSSADINGVFFDLYGTLLVYGDMDLAWDDSRRFVYEAFTKRGMTCEKVDFKSRCDGFFDQSDPEVEKGWEQLTVYERQLRNLGRDLGLELTVLDLGQIADGSVATWHQYTWLDPEAKGVLGYLKRKKKLALLSNFDHPRHVHALLAELELVDFFETIIVSGDTGTEKPDPAIFSMLLEQTKSEPHEAVYVGDALKEDVQGARGAGLVPIWIDRDRPSQLDAQPEAKAGGACAISSLTALQDLFT